MASQPIGSYLDALGVTADLDEGQQIAEVLVLAKVVSFEDGETVLGMYSSPSCDWITRLGLLHAGGEVLKTFPVARHGEED